VREGRPVSELLWGGLLSDERMEVAVRASVLERFVFGRRDEDEANSRSLDCWILLGR
jgi:hypothetical protein